MIWSLLCHAIAALAPGRWCLLSENAFDGSARTQQGKNAGEMVVTAGGQEHSPIAAPWEAAC